MVGCRFGGGYKNEGKGFLVKNAKYRAYRAYKVSAKAPLVAGNPGGECIVLFISGLPQR